MPQKNNDPMDFLRNMWGGKGFALPGIMTPTLDTEELEKRIKELKTVEGWLRTNLSMLQMTIQNLEMQSTTLSAVKTMSKMYSDQASGEKPGKPGKAAAPTAAPAAGSDAGGGLAQAAMWPWNLMQQMQEQMHSAAEAAAATTKATTNAGKSASAMKAEAPSSSAGATRNRRKPGETS
jgi:hypothetical protein